MKIVVHCTVSTQSVDYYRFLKASYKNLAAKPENLVFYAYCLDHESAEHLKTDSETGKVVELPNSGGSIGHALSIEAAVKNFQPNCFNLLADTDTAMLLKDWDNELTGALKDQDLIGITVYEDIGGWSSGTSITQTYKNIPTVTWMLFRPNISTVGLEKMLPDKDNLTDITTEELSRIYNLPIGFKLMKDVGWQIPEYLYKNKIKYTTLKPVKPSSKDAVVLAGTHDYHDEFHWKGQPFLVHQRGSMKHKFRIDPLSKGFYDAIDQYLGYPKWSVQAPFEFKDFVKRKLLKPLKGLMSKEPR